MTEEEREAWEAALAIHKVAEELRKKKEAEEAARIAAGASPWCRGSSRPSLCGSCRRNGRNRRGSAPAETPHPDDAETKAEL